MFTTNNILEELVNICNEIGATIMVFKIVYELKNDIVPMAIIEDNEGRFTTLYYLENEWR